MEGARTSRVPFISNAVFEPADIKVMSDAYNKAMDDIYGFGHPKKIVQEIIATGSRKLHCHRIMKIKKGGKRDPHRLRGRALD